MSTLTNSTPLACGRRHPPPHIGAPLRDDYGAPRVGSESDASPATSATPIVFVIDNDFAVRESLALLIRSAGLKLECFECADDFLARPRDPAPSCLLLDVNLPGASGLDLQRRLSVERLDMPVIFITSCVDVLLSVRAMKAGAVDFLTKPLQSEALFGAIRDAIKRSRAALDEMDEMLSLESRYRSLSRREREVMALVVSGLLNKQVGGELGISEITVKAHRGSLMRKMEAASLPHLVGMAIKLGLPSHRQQHRPGPVSSLRMSEMLVIEGSPNRRVDRAAPIPVQHEYGLSARGA